MKYQMLMGAVLGAALTGAIAAGSANAAGYKVMKDTIPASLTGKAGDPANGKKVAISRKKGNCLACHAIKDASDQPFHGEIGPPLDEVGANQTAAELRMRVVDPKVLNPRTIMPAFFKNEGLHLVTKKFKGKTMLSAQEVEDVVAYLLTLKGQYSN